MEDSKVNVTNKQPADSSSKIIFDEPVLCAQFLRDYTNIPMLKDVQPEDIEDVSERFVHMFAEERNADTVKRVRLKNQVPFFLVSLIEHKTYVDYNVSMQILRYMVFIWEDYEKEMNRLHEQDSNVKTAKQKDFKYPVILPIVYYEGKKSWTAAKELKERIWLQEEFTPYIPNFAYELIQLNQYSNESLLSHKDAISLLMMFNKLQDKSDISEFRQISSDEMIEITQKTPEYIRKIMEQVLSTFLNKINLPTEEAEEILKNVRENRMGYLFENMEKMDIQLERRLRKEAEENLEKGLKQARENAEKAAEKAKKLLVTTCQKLGQSRSDTCFFVAEELQVSSEEALKIVEQYWSNEEEKSGKAN